MEATTVEQLHEQTLVGRVAWLIRLRWLAIAALILTTLLVDQVLPVHLPLHAKRILLGIVVVIAAYNALFYRRLQPLRGLVQTDPARVVATVRKFTHLQILADLVCLTIILDLAGGLLNPLCVFMIFHVAIAGTILPRREAFWVSLLASLLLALMGILGAAVPALRVPLAGFPLEAVEPPLTQNWFYILSVCFSFSAAFLLIAYFTTGVSSQLKDALDDLEHANESLIRQDQLLSRFMRVAAHQLRSPMATVISLIQAQLSTIQARTLPPNVLDILGRIGRRCQALMALVDDLLRLTQIREGLDRQEATAVIDVNRVIDECCRPFKVQAIEKGLDLVIALQEHPAHVLARERDISDVVENLVSNAIKYTDAGHVRIEGKADEGRYCLTVSDTGIGIPAKDQEHLFKEFFRAGNAQKKDAHSSGLGLNIVQAIIDRMQGQITFASREGQGTTFKVILPLFQ